MAFNSTVTIDPVALGAGEQSGIANTVLSTETFEDGIRAGYFAKWDTGSLDELDESATPVIAGVVLRAVGSPVEDDGAYDSSLFNTVSFLRSGLVTVTVKAAETPAKFGQVYVSNAAGSLGEATATGTDVEVPGAEFIEEITTGVWLIRIK